MCDQDMVTAWVDLFDHRPEPRVGDFLDFADGQSRRIAHIWRLESGIAVQPDYAKYGASFYFGLGYCSFSGGLLPSIPAASLTLTDERRLGRVWTFHHNHATAHNGVYFSIPFRVYTCTLNGKKD